MRTIVIVSILGLMAMSHPTWAAKGAISQEYQGMWGAGGCSKAKYYMHIEGSGMQMYATDKRTPLGNWDVRNVQAKGNSIAINTQETNSKKSTHMELTKLSNGHIKLSLKIGGNGGIDELIGC